MTRDEHFAHARELRLARVALRRALEFPVGEGVGALQAAWCRGEAVRAVDVALGLMRRNFRLEFAGEANPYDVPEGS